MTEHTATQQGRLASLVTEHAKGLFAELAELERYDESVREIKRELVSCGYEMIPFEKIGIQKTFVFLHKTHVVKIGGSSDYEGKQYEEWPQDTKGMIARTERLLDKNGDPLNVIVQERCVPMGQVRGIIAKVISDSHEGNWGVRANSDGSFSLVIFDFVM